MTALQAGTVLLNQIKSAVTEQVGERLQDLSSHDLSIPLGSLTGVKIFSGRGPSNFLSSDAGRSGHDKFIS